MDLIKKIVPPQRIGTRTGATFHYSCASRHDALVLFELAKARLLDINAWRHISGDKGAAFQLTDEQGNAVTNRLPKTGDLVRIKLPAPPNAAGDGYDWVRIEKFEADKDLLADENIYGFRARPVKNPNSATDEKAHFYTGAASSTFLIYRKGAVVYAMEKGRNEVPNAKVALLNTIRNFLIAIPAMLGLAKPQWQLLVKALIQPKQL